MLFDTTREWDRLESAVLPTLASMASQRMWDAPIDVRRENDRYVVEMDLPGVHADSIDVSVDDGSLIIKAERSRSHESQTKDWVVRERSDAVVMRQIALSGAVEVDAIAGTHHNGVLTVTLPISEKAKPRKVAVSVEGVSPARELGASTGTDETGGSGKVETAHSVES